MCIINIFSETIKMCLKQLTFCKLAKVYFGKRKR